jgi:hypothetical protein
MTNEDLDRIEAMLAEYSSPGLIPSLLGNASELIRLARRGLQAEREVCGGCEYWILRDPIFGHCGNCREWEISTGPEFYCGEWRERGGGQ